MPRVNYTKTATNISQQIQKLRDRNFVIEDVEKAKEYLSDIGYYRLGFYFFPFELTYPLTDSRRDHHVKPGTKIEHCVALYYFDFDLRNILNKYLSRIEVAIRTAFIYELSNKYIANPYWFVDPMVVSTSFIHNFPTKVYDTIKNKEVIKRHRQKYLGNYAPAWKTMEYMMFGNLTTLYKELHLEDDKKLISRKFGVEDVDVFYDYLEVVRLVRNACAHGNVLYDNNTWTPVQNGPAGHFTGPNRHNLHTSLQVIRFLLSSVSTHRVKDLDRELCEAAIRLNKKCPSLRRMIRIKTGIPIPRKVSLGKFLSIMWRKLIKKMKNSVDLLAQLKKKS